MDSPNIHKIAFEGIVKPLVNRKVMKLNFVDWIPPAFKPVDDDDIDFD